LIYSLQKLFNVGSFLDFYQLLRIYAAMFTPLKLTTLLFFASATLLNAASLIWDKTEAHVEMTPEQEEARATFNVTNEGEKAVRIARIKTSCGCTGSIIDKKIIEPGESTQIIATFHKGRRKGLNRNKLQVFLDSQADPIVTLAMNVKVPTLIEAMPQIVYWNAGSSKTERRVRIKLDKQYVDELISIDYDQSQLSVTEEAGEAGSDVERVLVIQPKDFTKLYRGAVTLYATGPKGRKADSRIHVFVQP
jgi:hypothetical protein